MTRTLNVLYQSNNNYATITGVSITSLLKNNLDIDEINIYILNDQIKSENLIKMKEICDGFNRNLIIVDTDEILKKLKALKVAPFKNTYTTYFKLMAIKNLDLPTSRILQLDGDTIIHGSLAELCDMDLENCVCAATYDCTMNDYKTLIDIPLSDKYYNCGVLLINQDYWREYNCEEKIVNHLKNERSGYYTVDQDIINVLFRDKIKYLNITYNFNCGFYIYGINESLKMYNLKPPYYNSYEEVKAVMDNPVIYHCMGAMSGRPWEKDSIHPQNELFDEYLKISPWKNYEKISVNRSRIFKIQRQLYLLLPRKLYIPIHKIAQKQYLYSKNKKVENNLRK
ncbi:MAG: glycosyltransferase family 8 protein [Bacilli bacterium]